MISVSNGLHRTYQRAHGIFTVAALDGHDALRRARHMQSGICLQTNGTVRFRTRGKAGIASNAFSVVGNDKVIHGLPYSLSMKEKIGSSSMYNYNKRNDLSSDTSGFSRYIQLIDAGA
jgi:hypothetical protein